MLNCKCIGGNREFCTREGESSCNLEYLDPKYLENYTSGIDPVYCTKGTYNLDEFKLICVVTNEMWVFTTYMPFKTSQGMGVPEKLQCVTVSANSSWIIIEVKWKFSES